MLICTDHDRVASGVSLGSYLTQKSRKGAIDFILFTYK